MTINHINLVVSNLQNSIALFVTHFNFTLLDTKGEVIAILKNTENFTLVLSTEKDPTPYPKDFHIGFFLDTTSQVDQLYQHLLDDAYPLSRPPAKIRQSYGFYFTFNNLMIEVAC